MVFYNKLMQPYQYFKLIYLIINIINLKSLKIEVAFNLVLFF